MVEIKGPRWKGKGDYLSGTRTPGPPGSEVYGWPQGSECWFYEVEGFGRREFFASSTAGAALDAALAWIREEASKLHVASAEVSAESACGDCGRHIAEHRDGGLAEACHARAELDGPPPLENPLHGAEVPGGTLLAVAPGSPFVRLVPRQPPPATARELDHVEPPATVEEAEQVLRGAGIDPSVFTAETRAHVEAVRARLAEGRARPAQPDGERPSQDEVDAELALWRPPRTRARIAPTPIPEAPPMCAAVPSVPQHGCYATEYAMRRVVQMLDGQPQPVTTATPDEPQPTDEPGGQREAP